MNHTHDALPQIFLYLTEKPDRDKFFYEFRDILCNTRYYEWEDLHYGRPIRIATSAENLSKVSELGRNLDFYEAEKQWTNEVLEKTNFRIDEVLTAIFDSLFTHWADYPYHQDECKYFVGTGGRDPDSMRKLLDGSPESKIIFVHRDPRAVVASKGNRRYMSWETKSTSDYLRTGRIPMMRRQYQTILSLKERHDDRVLLIKFENLILNTERVMHAIVEFLDIEQTDILLTPTVCGKELEPAEQYIGEIKDDWQEMLSDSERFVADLQMGKVPEAISISGVWLFMKYLVRGPLLKTLKSYTSESL